MADETDVPVLGGVVTRLECHKKHHCSLCNAEVDTLVEHTAALEQLVTAAPHEGKKARIGHRLILRPDGSCEGAFEDVAEHPRVVREPEADPVDDFGKEPEVELVIDDGEEN